MIENCMNNIKYLIQKYNITLNVSFEDLRIYLFEIL